MRIRLSSTRPSSSSIGRPGSIKAIKLVRHLSASCHERVNVACGSAGHVSIECVLIGGRAVLSYKSFTRPAMLINPLVWLSLFNLDRDSPASPLIVYFPPSPSGKSLPAAVPDFLHNWPVARINYRWDGEVNSQDEFSKPHHWPRPAHDAAFAFSWLGQNLAPGHDGPRDVFVYGSQLGASLAVSLSLTESRSSAGFGVRGVVAYNGI